MKSTLPKHFSAFVLSIAAFATFTASFAASAQTDPPVPTVKVGRIERLAHVPSKFVDARHVDVWLPEGYSPGKRYAVLYMHDGQNLFDPGITWNRQAWNVHEAVQRLIQQGKIPETMVVGVWNNGPYRYSEYFPQKILDGVRQPLRGQLVAKGLHLKPMSDLYLRFLVEELKPLIDAKYATRTDAASTVLMGSSMGGLISVYAMNEYPKVFGGAAGLSTHWMGTAKPNAALPLAAYNYLRDHMAPPGTHRLYQDHGTTELDTEYAPYQRMVNDIVREAGYVDEISFMTRVYEGTGHSENAWSARLEVPLLFLLQPRAAAGQ